MNKLEILRYLLKHPEYARVLRLAVEAEEKHANEEHWLGWEWFDVQCYPATINKLIVDGIAKVTFSSSNFTHYRLVDLEATKEALADYEALTTRPVEAEERFEIPKDLFSPILGYEDVKELIKASLEQEKPVGFLFVGPVATPKSLFLEELNRISGSSFHLGSSATKAGLTQFLLSVRPRILLIDEFDKMNREDLAVLLSLMESGKVVETKYGRRSEEHMRVWVFASCNTLSGIPEENISRFRPFIFHFREYTREEFIAVAEKFLVEREGVEPKLARHIAERVSAYTRDVRAARGFGRICKDAESFEKYMETTAKYRGLS